MLELNKVDEKKLLGRYTIEVYEDTEEGGYIAKVVELGCIGDGATPDEAVADVVDVAMNIIKILIDDRKLPCK